MLDRLKEMTGNRGPDKCIHVVGLEATHGSPLIHGYDRWSRSYTGSSAARSSPPA